MWTSGTACKCIHEPAVHIAFFPRYRPPTPTGSTVRLSFGATLRCFDRCPSQIAKRDIYRIRRRAVMMRCLRGPLLQQVPSIAVAGGLPLLSAVNGRERPCRAGNGDHIMRDTLYAREKRRTTGVRNAPSLASSIAHEVRRGVAAWPPLTSRPFSSLERNGSFAAGGTNLDEIHRIVRRKLAAERQLLDEARKFREEQHQPKKTMSEPRPDGNDPVVVVGDVTRWPLASRHSQDADHTVLIDVRTEEECRATGIIPTAAHIPMQELQHALGAITSREGARAYGLPEPAHKHRHRLIFYCHAGVRSLAALQMAEADGFRSVSHFAGGWAEYCRRPVTCDNPSPP